jgi:hypothetical protein
MTCNQTANIDAQISLLKLKQAHLLIELKIHLKATGESLKPINILKTTATEVVSLVRAEGNIVNKMIELGVGEVGKKATSLIGNNGAGRFLGKLINFIAKTKFF